MLINRLDIKRNIKVIKVKMAREKVKMELMPKTL